MRVEASARTPKESQISAICSTSSFFRFPSNAGVHCQRSDSSYSTAFGRLQPTDSHSQTSRGLAVSACFGFVNGQMKDVVQPRSEAGCHVCETLRLQPSTKQPKPKPTAKQPAAETQPQCK